jgi:hypothetical protein
MTGPPNTSSHTKKQLASINKRIEFYEKQLKCHPIANYLNKSSVPEKILNEFAIIQYSDSLLWVPMLSLMKDRVKNVRLKRALRENMLCEAGANAISHIELCRRFLESMGIDCGNLHINSDNLALSTAELSFITALNEAQIAGWILAAEALVPVTFALFRQGFAHVKGVDLTYLNEHIIVDTDEHSQWMKESALELLSESACFDEIITGIDIGGRVVLRVPDALYAKVIRYEQSMQKASKQTKCG